MVLFIRVPHYIGDRKGDLNLENYPAPTGDDRNDAAQAPSDSALQLRNMAELLGPCVKSSCTCAPPPRPSGRTNCQIRSNEFRGALRWLSRTCLYWRYDSVSLSDLRIYRLPARQDTSLKNSVGV